MGHYDEFREAEYAEQDVKQKYIPPGLEYWNKALGEWLRWPHFAWGEECFRAMASNGTKFRIMGKEGKTVRVG